MTKTPSILAFCDRIGVPAPWSVGLAADRRGPYHTVLDANGRDLNYRIYDSEAEARTLTALSAFAPMALAYVEQSAAKGGVEAQKIVEAFRLAASTTPRTVAP